MKKNKLNIEKLKYEMEMKYERREMNCRNMASVSLEMEDTEWIHHSVGVGQSRNENEIEKLFFSWRSSVLN